MGCNAPRVSGLRASIKLKPDAVPRAQQSFKLSKCDETRLEFFEDQEAKEGKTYWPRLVKRFFSRLHFFIVGRKGKGCWADAFEVTSG